MDRDTREHNLDEEYRVPKEYITCPGCGRTYKQAGTVCRSCEECKKCCRCGEPDHVPARTFIEELIKRGIG